MLKRVFFLQGLVPTFTCTRNCSYFPPTIKHLTATTMLLFGCGVLLVKCSGIFMPNTPFRIMAKYLNLVWDVKCFFSRAWMFIFVRKALRLASCDAQPVLKGQLGNLPDQFSSFNNKIHLVFWKLFKDQCFCCMQLSKSKCQKKLPQELKKRTTNSTQPHSNLKEGVHTYATTLFLVYYFKSFQF